MALWDKYFRKKDKDQIKPTFEFGRFTDAYKPMEQYRAWDESLSLFDKQDYLETYRLFFKYLQTKEDHTIELKEFEDKLIFTFAQGSRQVYGKVDHNEITAESKIVKGVDFNIGLLRRILEHNYNLQYCRYSIDDDGDICLQYDSPMVDSSPYKSYFALKELSIQADKLDDLALHEFKRLVAVESNDKKYPKGDILEIHTNFFFDELDRVLNTLSNQRLNIHEFPGAAVYLIFNYLYKIDFLLLPQGIIMEMMEKLHTTYFAESNKRTQRKINELEKGLYKLRKVGEEELQKELYVVDYTFGITKLADFKQIQSFIKAELPNMDWYLDHNHLEYALAVPGYIVGYTLFNYAIDPLLKALLQLYYEVVEHHFFEDIGMNNRLIGADMQPKERKIKHRIEEIKSQFAKHHSLAKISTRHLKFDNIYAFAQSYLWMIYHSQILLERR
jgi:hypothetical protein